VRQSSGLAIVPLSAELYYFPNANRRREADLRSGIISSPLSAARRGFPNIQEPDEWSQQMHPRQRST
jgi:hypothetical protein